jgi:hypothetical protein
VFAINQVIRTKLYNSFLVFVYKKFFVIMWCHVSHSLLYLSSHILHRYISSRAEIVPRMRARLSSLSMSTKMLTSLVVRPIVRDLRGHISSNWMTIRWWQRHNDGEIRYNKACVHSMESTSMRKTRVDVVVDSCRL